MEKRNDIIDFRDWLSADESLLIAGPCGAETEEQVMQTAQALAAGKKVNLFRAGIWKPRTRPNSFEGVGEIGLKWLQQVKKSFGLKTTVEVATTSHVEKALKYGMDVLWIGARTTVNPFSVQDIADALRGTDVPVMIKNPVHPDLQLWIGAIERLRQSGIRKLIAVHRGFYNPRQSVFRNDPFWEIAIELRTACPDLPVICDPSHICGRRDLIKDVAQQAIDLGMRGLMIETHVNPDSALSDAKQQLTPDAFHALLAQLKFRKQSSEDERFRDKLSEFRRIIDMLDEEMILLLKKRSDVIEKIGEYKKDHDITIFQLERWIEILETRTESALTKGFQKEFIERLCQLLHEESIRKQHEVMNR